MKRLQFKFTNVHFIIPKTQSMLLCVANYMGSVISSSWTTDVSKAVIQIGNTDLVHVVIGQEGWTSFKEIANSLSVVEECGHPL